MKASILERENVSFFFVKHRCFFLFFGGYNSIFHWAEKNLFVDVTMMS